MKKINQYFFSDEKRVFDLIFCIIVLLVISPLIVFFVPTYLFFNGFPFLFKQKRVGKNKKVFTIYKIRTMKVGSEKQQSKLRSDSIAPKPMFKVKNDPRFITFGKTLSKFGLDEIPQIINIIKGEMSLVGPRPLPVYEAKKLPRTWDFRYEVKPGILSYWALSPSRYDSLTKWRELEIKTIEIDSVKKDAFLIIIAIYQLFIERISRAISDYKDTSE